MQIGVGTYDIEGLPAQDLEIITAALMMLRTNQKKRLDDYIDNAVEADDNILEVKDIYHRTNKLFEQFRAIRSVKNEPVI